MTLSFRIIKSADVRGGMLQALPLRRYTPEEEPLEAKDGGSGGPDAPSDLQAWAAGQAEEIISRARATADEIIRQVQLESEKIKEEAYRSAFEQGYREGSEQGYREGVTRAEEEAAAIRAQARTVLEQAEQIRRRTLESLEEEIVALAREIAEKLVAMQLVLEPESILAVVREALGLVAGRLSVVLYVNPAELALVESRKDGLRGLLPAKAELQVIADPSVQPGGCRVETEQGRVDATMGKRWEELLRALYGGER